MVKAKGNVKDLFTSESREPWEGSVAMHEKNNRGGLLQLGI